jgi:hypothetical protein
VHAHDETKRIAKHCCATETRWKAGENAPSPPDRRASIRYDKVVATHFRNGATHHKEGIEHSGRWWPRKGDQGIRSASRNPLVPANLNIRFFSRSGSATDIRPGICPGNVPRCPGSVFRISMPLRDLEFSLYRLVQIKASVLAGSPDVISVYSTRSPLSNGAPLTEGRTNRSGPPSSGLMKPQ